MKANFEFTKTIIEDEGNPIRTVPDEKGYQEYLRTYFSCSAMQGLLSDSEIHKLTKDNTQFICETAIAIADEMLKKLKNT